MGRHCAYNPARPYGEEARLRRLEPWLHVAHPSRRGQAVALQDEEWT